MNELAKVMDPPFNDQGFDERSICGGKLLLRHMGSEIVIYLSSVPLVWHAFP